MCTISMNTIRTPSCIIAFLNAIYAILQSTGPIGRIIFYSGAFFFIGTYQLTLIDCFDANICFFSAFSYQGTRVAYFLPSPSPIFKLFVNEKYIITYHEHSKSHTPVNSGHTLTFTYYFNVASTVICSA